MIWKTFSLSILDIYFLAFLQDKCPYRVVFIVIFYRITKVSHGRMLNIEENKSFVYCPLGQRL
jgi:hypothetical protein